MKVFKQESTQRTSKAFKQHTFAVLFDHSVFWQGAPIPQKMGIKSSLSVGLNLLPQAILPSKTINTPYNAQFLGREKTIW